MKDIFLFVWHLPRNVLVLLVRLYQKTLSPDTGIFVRVFFPGGYCKHTPTCSEYTVLALKKYGVLQGVWKSFFRVLRCNPWRKGGMDLP